MHMEWIMESKKEWEQPGWREKELAFDSATLKNFVGFFSVSTLTP